MNLSIRKNPSMVWPLFRRIHRAAFIGLTVGLLAAVVLSSSGCSSVSTSVAPEHPLVLASKILTSSAGGTLTAPNGVKLVAPPHLIKARTARASIIEESEGVYDVHISGQWHGSVTVEIPTTQKHPYLLHRVDGTWVVEMTTKVGNYAIAKLTSLSWLKPALLTVGLCLVGIIGTVITDGGAGALAVECLVKAGVVKVAASIAKIIYGAIFKYNPCQPLAITNLPVSLTDITHACTASAPAVTKPAPGPQSQPAAPAPASSTQPAPVQPSPPQAPAPSPPAPASGRVADGGYVGYAKNSYNTSDPNFYYWHYLSLCVSNVAAGQYTVVFSDDGASGYHTMTLNLPSNGCISTGQQGGTLKESGSPSDWYSIEVVGQFITPHYQPWT